MLSRLSVMVGGMQSMVSLVAGRKAKGLQEVMEKAARAAADAHRFGRYVFFLYDQTGEEAVSHLDRKKMQVA